MVPLLSLWLPTLASGVAVFAVSSVIHMVLKYHANDFRTVPDADAVQEALRPFAIPPGEYMLPRAASMAEMQDPAFVAKLTKGPVAIMTVLPNRPFTMGKSLAAWFAYTLVVSVFAAYLAGRALGLGAPALAVFRFAGCTAFVGYALALWQDSIWHARPLATTLKMTFDGLLYGLVTGAVFAALWPQ